MIKEESRFAPSDIMEGMISFRAVVKGIRTGISDRRIIKVLFDKSKTRVNSRHLSYIRAMSRELRFELSLCEAAEIESITVGSSHGGIVTLCTPRALPRLDASHVAEKGFYVMLDGIEDPYNFGYALRSVCAAGADGVILPPRNWMSASGVVCRASAGAAEELPLYVADPSSAADIFKKCGYRIACADMDNSVSLWDADLSLPLFAVIGGEKRGISSALLEKCDCVVRIDYGREFPAALSAASAAAIISFEVLRQNSSEG